MAQPITTLQFHYMDEESISGHLKCSICTNPFVLPLKTNCRPREHTFCQSCILPWVEKNDSCPSCRQTINKTDLTPITRGILLDLLDELLVNCPSCQQSRIQRGNYELHLRNECSKMNISCTSADVKCPWSGSREQLDQHLTSCPYTALRLVLIEMIHENRELHDIIEQQQSLIEQLHKAKHRDQRPTEKIADRPPAVLKRSNETVVKFSVPPIVTTKPARDPCSDCADCWRGAVRGTYFRGESGGGLQPRATLIRCSCQCHD